MTQTRQTAKSQSVQNKTARNKGKKCISDAIVKLDKARRATNNEVESKVVTVWTEEELIKRAGWFMICTVQRNGEIVDRDVSTSTLQFGISPDGVKLFKTEKDIYELLKQKYEK